MTLEEKINSVIGTAYDYKKANCWDLVMFLAPGAPRIEEMHQNILTTAKKFKEYEKANKNKYEKVVFPINGDIVLLGHRTVLNHAGIFYNNGVVHASRLGVIWQSLADIKKAFKMQKAYRCK